MHALRLRNPVAPPVPPPDPAAGRLRAQALDLSRPRRAPLSEDDMQAAIRAWAWFAAQSDPVTGFPPDLQGAAPGGFGNVLSPAGMGATLLAIVAAARLGLVGRAGAEAQLARCLATLAALPLDRGGLPARAYAIRAHGGPQFATASGAAASHPWRPAGLMRLLAGFLVVAADFPDTGPAIAAILKGWRLDSLKAGAAADAPPVLGAEQYAARVAGKVGLALAASADPRAALAGRRAEGLLLPVDRRPGVLRQVIPVDFLLAEALEFGWSGDMLDIALGIHRAQRAYFLTTGNPVAPASGAVPGTPGFLMQGPASRGAPFGAIDATGRPRPDLAFLSTAAAFGWDALIPSPFSRRLRDAVALPAGGPGWPEGWFLRAMRPNPVLSAATNAMVLAAIHYRARGPLFAD